MSVYTVHLKPDSEPVLVREGFSWLALLFGPLWLALHRAWLAAAFSLAGYVLIAVLLPAPGRAVLTQLTHRPDVANRYRPEPA